MNTIPGRYSVWNPPRIEASELWSFVYDFAGLAGVDLRRVGRLLLEQVCFAAKTACMNAFSVTDVVQRLEGRSRFPPPRLGRFNHPPLKGLSKVHFVDPMFIAKNVELEGQRRGREQRFKSYVKRHRPSTRDEWLNVISYFATVDAYDTRAARGALTGEWIVLATHPFSRLHYYLTLARHDEGDEVIFERILRRCTRQFPWVLQ